MAEQRRALARGLADTKRIVFSPEFEKFDAMSGLAVAACVGLFVSQRTDSSLLQNVLIPLSGLAWMAGLALLILLWNLFRAPYRLLKEIPPAQDRVDATIRRLSKEARDYLELHAELLASGATGLEIGRRERNELTLKGIAQVEYVPTPDEWTGQQSAASIWKLTDFGKEVVAKIRYG